MAIKNFKLKFLELPVVEKNNEKSNNNNVTKIFRSDILNNIYLSSHNQLWRMNMRTSTTDTNFISIYGPNQLSYVFEIDEHKDLLISTTSHIFFLHTFYDKEIWVNKVGNTTFNVWNDIIFGRFYHDISRIGAIVIPRDTVKQFEFSEIVENHNNYSFRSINTNFNIFDNFCQNSNSKEKIRLIRLRKEPKLLLMTRSSDKLCIFEFNSEDIIKITMEIPYVQREDKLFFPNLNGHMNLMDMVAFNSSGLFVYSYRENSPTFYDLIHYNPTFSIEKGWTEKHTETVQFEDIDDDGCDDMIFTGPSGIAILSFNIFRKKWISLLNTMELTPAERHSKITHVVPKMIDRDIKPMLFSYDSNNIRWAVIIETDAESLEILPVNQNFFYSSPNYTTQVPKIRAENNQQQRTTLYLRDKDIWFEKTESVNPGTGNPNFLLPLVGDIGSKIQFSLFYDERKKDNNLFGFGWSTSQSFIALNYQDGNFEEDESYTLITENIVHNLKYIPSHSYYELENESNVYENANFKAEFDSSKNIWVIKYGIDQMQIYGPSRDTISGAIVTESSWKNWRGTGFDKVDAVERANIWYLAAQKYNGIWYYYQYIVIKKYTEWNEIECSVAAYLKRIYSENDELIFSYNNNYEFEEEDANANSSIYLTGYTYKTKSKEQIVFFRYTKIGENVLFTSLYQKFDYVPHPVIEFKYEELSKGKFALKKIILPTKAEIIYEYSHLGKLVPLNEKDGRTVTISDDYIVSYSNGLILVSYVDKILKQIILRMFNNDVTEEIYPVAGKKRWPPLGPLNSVDFHEILLDDTFLAVVAYSAQLKTLYLFAKIKEEEWVTNSVCYEYSEETLILKGENYILVSEPASITLFEWMNGNWQKSLNQPFEGAVSVNGKKFVLYDDENIYLGYKDKKRNWILKQLYIGVPGFLSETKNTLYKFRLERNFEKAIIGFFRNNAIQIRHNIIVLSSLSIHNDQQFRTKIKTYIIGRNHDVAMENETFIQQDNIAELFSKEENNSTGYKLTLKYVYIYDTIQITIDDFINEGNKTKEDMSFSQKIFEDLQSPAKRFLLDLKHYYVSLQGSTVQCRNVQYIFGGSSWYRKEIERNATFADSVSISLGTRFLVKKADAVSNVKLYDASSKRTIFDYGVIKPEDVQMHYPIYSASQKKGGPLNIVEFLDDKKQDIMNTTLSNRQELSPFGNRNTLITHLTHVNESKTLFIYPMSGVRRFLPNFVVTSLKLAIPWYSGGVTERITGYEYDQNTAQLINNQIRYRKMSVIPGNNKRANGYFRITQKSTDFFNGENELVKSIPHNEQQVGDKAIEDEDMKRKNKATTVYDKSGLFEIANFFPFNTSSGMAGFISFEDYEEPTDNWTFNRENCIRREFSLTGRNYLRLNNELLKGIFQPKFQDTTFIASCWIRSVIFDRIPALGDIVPYLVASVLTADGNQIMNFLSDVKYQIDNWSYLEVYVDLEFIKLILKSTNKMPYDNLQIKIWISPMRDAPIDVDNARFGPIDSYFDLNIFNEELRKKVAVVKSSGNLIRYIYDEHQEQIAVISESNQIIEIMTYTKGSYRTGGLNNPACIVTLVPQRGFYEDFSPFSFYKQWVLEDSQNWEISPGLLCHHSFSHDFVLLRNGDISSSSFGFRLLYSLKDGSFVVISEVIQMQSLNGKVEIIMLGKETTKQIIPDYGEILFVKEEKRIFVWINGQLYIDQHSYSSDIIKFSVAGEVQFQHMMIFSRPQIKIAYKNTLNEVIQEISLVTSDSVIIAEKLYDELGKQRINVQPVEVTRGPLQSLMSFDNYLVTNKNGRISNSLWKTGKLLGKINNIVGHEFGFSEIVYDNNPLNVKIRFGRPGEKFTKSGLYAVIFNSTILNSFVLSRYPRSKNFTYQAQLERADYAIISVYDYRNLKVASYIQLENGDDILSTFEYNKNGKLIKCLLPMYYEQMGDLRKNRSYDRISTENEQEYQKLSIRIDYDDRGNPIRKIIPDAGILENVYNEQNQLRFIIQYSQFNLQHIETITYFLYDVFGRLTSTGNLRNFPATSNLANLTNILEKDGEEFQRFYYSDSEQEPAFRGKLERILTTTQQGFLYEEFINDVDDNVISKRRIIPNESDRPLILSIDKRFQGGRLKEIIYPALMFGETFRIYYEYDKLGRMISIGIPGEPDRFLTMTYNANNQIVTQTLTPHSSNAFFRTFKYNEVGFLVEINDKYLTEEISYTENSYTGRGYGDGKITRIKFTAKWHKLAHHEGIGVNSNDFKSNCMSAKNSRKCFNELKRKGYLNARNQQTRVFYEDLDERLSLACTKGIKKRRVKEILGKNGFPEKYGFRFDYGDYMTLRYAKYFVGSEAKVFQPNTFAEEIPGISKEMSQNIWSLLKSYGYIIEDDKSYGKPGRSFVRIQNLIEDLKTVNSKFEKYAPLLKTLLISRYANHNSNNSRQYVEGIIKQWFHNRPIQYKTIRDVVLDGNYHIYPVEANFLSILKDYGQYLKKIVLVMQNYFATSTRSEFDMELFESDANGNRKRFYSGHENYLLEYAPMSNQIKKIYYKNHARKRLKSVFEIKHDSRGNVIQALHKGIQHMRYHPVSNRLQNVKMENGNTITFDYDSKGERIFKRLSDHEGETKSEIQYIRDEKGRSLIERKLTFIAAGQKPDILVTMYIYGTESLIGFVRRDHFYSVITDHQGSIRLVICEGEVVAAYDYMPYGNLMRIYGSNPDAHISYRYTGQEWDPDLGLYNYHARLYDPSLGRFYQIDPVIQYQSPYVYVYNSPISIVDPSGKIPWGMFFVVAGFGVLGAYLFAADANENINPMRWDWSSKTQLGFLVGSFTGAMIPIGFTTSLAALTGVTLFKAATTIFSVGVTVAYMTAAARNNNEWNLIKWDYASTKTWSAVFEGFSAGVGIIGGIKEAMNIFQKLNGWKKITFGSFSALFGALNFLIGGFVTGWDLRKPDFWLATLTSVFSAGDMPLLARSILKFLRNNSFKILQNLQNFDESVGRMLKYRQTDRTIFHWTFKRLIFSHTEVVTISEKLMFGSLFYSFYLYSIWRLLNEKSLTSDLTQLTVYHNILLGSTMMGKMIDICKLLKVRMQQLSKQHSSQSLAHMAQTLSIVVADLYSQDWRAVPVYISGYRKPRSVSENFPDKPKRKSKLVLAIRCSNIFFAYLNNRFTNPIIIVKNMGENDTNTKKPSDTFDMNPFLTRNLSTCIINIQKSMENKYRQQFCQEFPKGWKDANLTSGKIFNSDTLESCKNSIQKFYSYNNQSIDKDYIIEYIEQQQPITEQTEMIQENYFKFHRELLQIRRLIEANTFITFHKRIKLMLESKYLQILVKSLKRKEVLASVQQANIIGNILWNKLSLYSNSCTRWEFTNCAEPSSFLLPSHKEYRKQKLIHYPNMYDFSHDLNYLSSYKLEDVPELNTFEKCRNCIRATPKVRIVVRDVGWLAHLNTNFNRQLESSKIISNNNLDQISITKKRDRRFILTEIDKNKDGKQTTSWFENISQWLQMFWPPSESYYKKSRVSSLQDFSLNFTKESDFNFLNFSDQLVSRLATNETLLIAEILLAKCRNRKIYRPFKNQIRPDLPKNQILACAIIELYEKLLEDSAKASGFDMKKWSISNNSYELYEEIIHVATKNELHKISKIMKEYAMEMLKNVDKNINPGKRKLFAQSIQNFLQRHGKYESALWMIIGRERNWT